MTVSVSCVGQFAGRMSRCRSGWRIGLTPAGGDRNERDIAEALRPVPVRSYRRSDAVRRCDTDALLSRWREDRDRDARDELIARFLPLARRIAGRYRAAPEPIEDLVQVASLGLLGAIDRFDPARGIPFVAFAVPTIVGELKHYRRSTGWSAHVPPSAQEFALRVDRAGREITAQSGRPARVAELAEHLEVTIENVLAGLDIATAHYSISLDTPASTTDGDEAHAIADDIGAEDANYEMVETVISISAAGRGCRLSNVKRSHYGWAGRRRPRSPDSSTAHRCRCHASSAAPSPACRGLSTHRLAT